MSPDPPDLFERQMIRGALRSAAEDPTAIAARASLCTALVGAFNKTGTLLRFTGNIFGPGRVDRTSPFGNGDDALVGLGYLCEIAASLISGAQELLDRGNCYAGSTLNRQLVEVEYLAWAFTEDQEEAASWLKSTREERLQRWQPWRLRKRSEGRFRATDYAEHCDLGGHPTPQGARALIGDGGQPKMKQFILRETVVHGTSAWNYMQAAVAKLSEDRGFDPDIFIGSEIAGAVAKLEEGWAAQDRVASVWHFAQSKMG